MLVAKKRHDERAADTGNGSDPNRNSKFVLQIWEERVPDGAKR